MTKVGEASEVKALLHGRRRSLIVPGEYHLKVTLWVAAFTFAFLAVVDLLYFKLQQYRSAPVIHIAPNLAPMIQGQDRYEMTLVLFGSAVTLVAVVLFTFFETRKTAVPLYRLAKSLEQLGQQGTSTRLRLRKSDYFQGLPETFNRAMEALEARTLSRSNEASLILQELRTLSDELSGSAPQSSGDYALRLRNLAANVERLKEDLDRG
jgi:hypothetical protein